MVHKKRERKMKKLMSTLVLISTLGVCAYAVTAYPRVVTPNNDGWNDSVVVQFENPALFTSSGEIYDLSGAKVSDMRYGTDPYTMLMWDGRRSGQSVPSGVYFFRIEVGEKIFSGTVLVAK
jgi:gliding motility-associated-like protein